jgi:hypothetical protein
VTIFDFHFLQTVALKYTQQRKDIFFEFIKPKILILKLIFLTVRTLLNSRPDPEKKEKKKDV